MKEIPDLLSLCLDSTASEIIHGDERYLQNVFELPTDLFDCLVTRLPPLGLQKLHQQMSFKHFDESTIDGFKDGKKRGRYRAFNLSWKSLFELRWPDGVRQAQPINQLTKQTLPGFELTSFSGDWQQMYWETHLQNCLDKSAEAALLPSFDGCLGEIRIPDTILKSIGHTRCQCHTTCAYSKLSYHCHEFGCYTRCLRLQNVLCVPEISRLLRYSKLRSLVIRGIKSEEHVNGTCKLLKQNSDALSSLEFIYCKFSSSVTNAICNSLYTDGIQTHGVQCFSIKASSVLESNDVSLPSGLVSFLSLGRKFSNCLPSVGTSKSLWSLRVLNLRGNNLRKDDINSLRYTLHQMPNLESLDLSENPIGDDGIRNLIPFFVEASEKDSRLSDVKIENCDLSNDGVTELLDNLSTLKKVLDSLSIADNDLGRQVAEPLAKFLGASNISSLNIEEIGLGPSGFCELCEKLPKEMKLSYINMSKNRGGIEAAKFIVELISRTPQLIRINAAYNFMPSESLEFICSALKLSKGRLEQLDLTGNSGCYQPSHSSILAEFQYRGRPIMILPSPVAFVPYDDDP